jgi:hypothetical protein
MRAAAGWSNAVLLNTMMAARPVKPAFRTWLMRGSFLNNGNICSRFSISTFLAGHLAAAALRLLSSHTALEYVSEMNCHGIPAQFFQASNTHPAAIRKQ